MAGGDWVNRDAGVKEASFALAEAPLAMPIVDLLNRGWRVADTGEHALGRLLGVAIDSYRLVVMMGKTGEPGVTTFQAFLLDRAGEVSRAPVLAGLYRQGKDPDPSAVEVLKFSARATFASRETKLTANELWDLFGCLAELVPPGGQLTVEYDGVEHRDTAKSLDQGIPPILTPLGHMLFSAGCAGGFKDCRPPAEDWGARRLESFKPLNSQHALLKVEEFRREIKDFHERTATGGLSHLEMAARERALDILLGLRARSRPPRSGADSSLFFG